jgi:hypothetical protein
LRRWLVAIRDNAFKSINHRVVIETLPEDLLLVLRSGKICANIYLRRLQNHCLGMGRPPVSILPKKLFPKNVHGEDRAITWEEHCRIVAR